VISDEPAWPQVESWIANAANHVRVPPIDRAHGEQTLQLIQVTTRSALGAVALETAGLIVDHGWIRVLGGAGQAAMNLANWNGLAEPYLIPPMPAAFVVAHDVLGGLFALNGGAFDGEQGDAFYFAPDSLKWFGMEMGYSPLLQWLLAGDVSSFYRDLRWQGWKHDAPNVEPDQGFHLYPPPFSVQGRPIDRTHRTLVPITELCAYYRDAAQQFADLPEGAFFRVDPEV
jgi:hypothetical protein